MGGRVCGELVRGLLTAMRTASPWKRGSRRLPCPELKRKLLRGAIHLTPINPDFRRNHIRCDKLLATQRQVCRSSGPTLKGPTTQNWEEKGHTGGYISPSCRWILFLGRKKASLLGPQSSWQRTQQLQLPEATAGTLGLAATDGIRW